LGAGWQVTPARIILRIPQFLGSIRAMNRFERIPLAAGEAQLRYLDGDYRIVRPGSFVRCAVTGEPIPLDELKYWSVDLQEAYSSPEVVLSRLHPERSKR
jgi:hypothetical protein